MRLRRPVTSRRRWLAAAAAAATTAAAWVPGPATSAAAHDEVTGPAANEVCLDEVTPESLAELFGDGPGAMAGGDYQRTLQLDDGRVLWTFQDVVRHRGRMLHNAGMVQDGACFTLLTGPGRADWLFAEDTDPRRRWFWALDSLQTSSSTVDVYVVEMRELGDTYLGRATPFGVYVVTVDTKEFEPVGVRPAAVQPTEEHPGLYGWSIVDEGTWTYTYTWCYRQFTRALWNIYTHDRRCTPDVHVSRTPSGDHAARPEWFDGGGWSPDQDDAVPVIPAGPGRDINPASVAYIGGRFVAITKSGDWWGDTIYIDHSPTAYGPWTTVASFKADSVCTGCTTYFAEFVAAGVFGQAPDRVGLLYSLGNNVWDHTPGWRALYHPTFHALPPLPAPDASRYVALTPCRLADTRESRPAASGVVPVSGRCGVPDNASAVAVTVTAVAGDRPGFVTVTGERSDGPPKTSTVNVAAGEVRANTAIVDTPDSGIHVTSAGNPDYVVDVTGAWVPSGATAAGRYVPVPPQRVLDTRHGAARPEGPFDVDVTAAVPHRATAAFVNVTVVDSERPGFVTAWPAGPRPLASTLNTDAAGQVRSAATIVSLNGGRFVVESVAGGDIVVDVTGYFTSETDEVATAGLYMPHPQLRVVDTRGGTDDNADVPVELPERFAAAAVVNVTAVEPSADGFLNTGPAGSPTSTVNFHAADIAVANLTIVADDGAGVPPAVQRSTRTHVLADVGGYFLR